MSWYAEPESRSAAFGVELSGDQIAFAYVTGGGDIIAAILLATFLTVLVGGGSYLLHRQARGQPLPTG